MTTSDASVIEHAADVGIVHFDTAREVPERQQRAHGRRRAKSRRKSVVVSTKTQAATKAEAEADLDTSLRELGTDYVDIWYLHMATSRPK